MRIIKLIFINHFYFILTNILNIINIYAKYALIKINYEKELGINPFFPIPILIKLSLLI